MWTARAMRSIMINNMPPFQTLLACQNPNNPSDVRSGPLISGSPSGWTLPVSHSS